MQAGRRVSGRAAVKETWQQRLGGSRFTHALPSQAKVVECRAEVWVQWGARRALVSAPCAISCSTTRTWPCRQAQCSAVRRMPPCSGPHMQVINVKQARP